MQKLIIALAFGLLLAACQDKGPARALISTEYGDITIELLDSTPVHRDNFIQLVNEGFYDSLLFHRVISGFMIQGGDPDSKDAPAGQMLGQGGPGYTLDAEIGAYHYQGAVAAARLGDAQNPERKSSGSQFYIVEGQPMNEQILSQIEQQKGMTYTPEVRQQYIERGGYPPLDNEYTVFGYVVEGMEVINEISKVATDRNNRPAQDIPMSIKIINN